MPDLKLSLLDALPEAAVQLSGETVVYLNEAARGLLPGLEAGGGLPDYMDLPGHANRGLGVFTARGEPFFFQVSRAGEERMLLFRPAPSQGLTTRELEGLVRQLRELLGDVMAEVGPLTARGTEGPSPRLQADLTKSCHRLFRLVNNVDFVRCAAGEEGVPFRPVTMDLAGLCRELTRGAGDLLRYTDTTLWYDAPVTSLLIPGDPELLRRMLLGLVANATRAAKGGTVTVSLQVREDRGVISITDSGGALTPGEKAALLQRCTGKEAPLPGQGAGLGLSIARKIAAMHKGALLMDLGEDDVPTALVSLPTGPLDPWVKVEAPAADRDGGLDPLLVELSDVLPAECFMLEGLD